MKKSIYIFVFAVLTYSCMKVEKNSDEKANTNAKRMTEFYEKVMNAHDPSMIDSFVTDDMKDHMPPPPTYPAGKEGLKSFFRDWFTAFPDLHADVKWVKTFGDTAIAYVKMTGTNTGSWMGAPATNKKMDIESMDIVIIKDGKATEHWGMTEEMKMMTQLGMMQSPGDSTSMYK